jgi:hypothetical protein
MDSLNDLVYRPNHLESLSTTHQSAFLTPSDALLRCIIIAASTHNVRSIAAHLVGTKRFK